MSFAQDNKSENDRLRAIMARLTDHHWSLDLGGDWTVGTLLCHLAYWDRMTSVRIKKWMGDGTLTAVPDGDNIECINNSVRFLSRGVGRVEGIRTVQEAADEIDSIALSLSPDQLNFLEANGRDRWFRRSLHRQHHLARIEKALL